MVLVFIGGLLVVAFPGFKLFLVLLGPALLVFAFVAVMLGDDDEENNKCRNCGHELDEDAIFCPNCGTKRI